jgi:hypothetical protein
MMTETRPMYVRFYIAISFSSHSVQSLLSLRGVALFGLSLFSFLSRGMDTGVEFDHGYPCLSDVGTITSIQR